jgi:hypothetical protein
MTKLHRHLHTGVHEWRMTDEERRAMRGSLEAHMEAHPLGGMKSPYGWVSFTHARSMVLVPVLILMLGSGTAFAAQNALPGDALYAIKINVNEAVAGALAVSDEAKASYNTKVAAERLKEAQTLAAANKLSADTTDTLAQSYDAHATLAVAYADKVENDDAVKGAELRANLASLKAEGEVLATVAGKDGSQETKHNAVTLASRAGASGPRDDGPAAGGGVAMAMTMMAPASESAPRGFAAQTFSASMDVQDTARNTASAQPEHPDARVSDKAIASLKARAEAQLQSLRSLAKRQDLDASTSAALTARLDDLQALIDSAQAASGTEALSLYQRALSQGTVLKTFLSASRKFKLDILAPLLHVRDGGSDNEQAPAHSDDRQDSDRWDRDRNWRGDSDTGVATTTSAADTVAPAAASSTTTVTSANDAAVAEPNVPASDAAEEQGGGTTGSAGGGGGAVRDLIKAVANGLHL